MPSAASKRPLAIAFIVYALLVAAVMAGLFAARSFVLVGDNGESDAQWQEWRKDAAKQDGSVGPVARRTPKSATPPLVLLMRDHFPATAAGLLLPFTALYIFSAWTLIGVLRQARENPT